MPKLVALALPGGQDFVNELTRIWERGDVAFPVDLRLPNAAKNLLFEQFGVWSVVDAEGEQKLSTVGSVVIEGDAIVLATSGTTGKAKGVVHTHESVAASARLTAEALGVTRDDHWVACLPLSHIGGLSVVMRSVLNGTKLTALPSFEAEEVNRLGREGATLISLVNTALRRINGSNFRKILLGGAPPLENRPDNAVVTYGMTETGSGVVYDNYPLHGVALRTDASGQLMIKSPTLMRCYSDGSNPRNEHGWFPTGDSGAVHDDGCVEVFGRLSDVVNTGGQKVWPTQVEQVLKLHPAINEALVFGSPDPDWDERVVAHIEMADDSDVLSLAEVRDHTKLHLAAYCAPRELKVVGHIERTTSGKVRRPPK